MALSPLQPIEEQTETTVVTTEPTKTYKLDFENGVIGDFIDDDEALRQFIYKAIRTARFRYLIYDD
jgi:hypothetical protein